MEKSPGITESERLLARLCHNTFLGFWSYPNVYREPGHELVDLLVVCGRDVILFSDKRCQFQAGESLPTSWTRWYKRAVHKSAQQLFGAERWIKEQPGRLYLDAACQQPLPLSIEPQECRFHRIVVASGAKEACSAHLGGSGSLMIAPQIRGEEHTSPDSPQFQPFFVGTVMPEKGWVHVLDDVTLPLILGELDTISDFLNYLAAKERLLLTDGLGAVIAGEENLLGTFLANDGLDFEKMTRDLAQSEATLMIADGIWSDYCKKGRRDRRQFLGSDSRKIWDTLIIQEFAVHAFQGTLIPGSPISIAANEQLLRVLATESRVARAFLTQSMMERCFSSPLDRVAFRVVPSPTHPDTLYAFLLMPCRKRNDKQHRAERQALLSNYLFSVAYRRRQYRRIVGIATELGDFPYRTFDIMVLEVTNWTSALKRKAKACLAALELVPTSSEDLRQRPSRDFIEASKIHRNDLCPCGSGKKFKKCCMRSS